MAVTHESLPDDRDEVCRIVVELAEQSRELREWVRLLTYRGRRRGDTWGQLLLEDDPGVAVKAIRRRS